jgi:hypothetical protein
MVLKKQVSIFWITRVMYLTLLPTFHLVRIQDNVVSILTWQRPRLFQVQIPAKIKHFSVLNNVKTGSGTYSASYLMGTGVLPWR